jgi:hypothetical protein
MKAKELDYVRGCIDNESFDYAFVHYSHFENINDQEFHRLREAYLKAGKELAEYLGVDI